MANKKVRKVSLDIEKIKQGILLKKQKEKSKSTFLGKSVISLSGQPFIRNVRQAAIPEIYSMTLLENGLRNPYNIIK